MCVPYEYTRPCFPQFLLSSPEAIHADCAANAKKGIFHQIRHCSARDPIPIALFSSRSIYGKPFHLLARVDRLSHQANPGTPSSALLLPVKLPSSQSVTLITLVAFSQLPPSSACSMTCFFILPSPSNSKMKRPVNSSSAGRGSVCGRSPSLRGEEEE